jgi:glycosyltransferase involved in cell wall biosynthesis
MIIAVEAHALSQNTITGVGNVILHYLNQLQNIDTQNEYFIYSMDDLKHVSINNAKWRYVDFKYPLKKMRIRISSAWLTLKKQDGPGAGISRSLQLMLLRISKIALETTDELVFSWKLASSLKKNRVDVYIGTSTYYFPYFFFSPVKKVGILYDLVWKLYPETMEFGNRMRMKLFAVRTMKKLDLLISISENTKKDARAILNLKTRIEAIPLAADNNIFHRAEPSTISAAKKKYGITKKYMLTVCTLEPRKNLKALLAAYRTMPGRRDYQLVLVGMTGWITTDFFREIEASDIGGNMIMTGYVPNTDLAPLYTGAEVFVFPTWYEGFGLPVLEAMQCGCPVITSNTSSIPEVAGDAAIMLDPDDVAGLSESMEKVLNNDSLRKELSGKGIRRSKLFSWDKSARMFLKSVSSLLTEPKERDRYHKYS